MPIETAAAAAVLVGIVAIGSFLDLDLAVVAVEVVVCCQICNQQMRRRRTAIE